MLETALAGPDARDVWRRVRYVVDQARAWTEAGGRGVRRYLRWARFQASEGRASDTILPERDHDAVRVMTVHAAKGLEFPITVRHRHVHRGPPAATARPSCGWATTWALAEKGNELFEEYLPLDEQMGDAERRRLLYVACTRAVDHLVVSVHRKPLPGAGDLTRAPSAHVLTAGGALAHGATVLDDAAVPVPRAAGPALELPWADARRVARRARPGDGGRGVAGRRRAPPGSPWPSTWPATTRALVADPGLAKDGVDLDLPPWQRGRYGTAIGRAVHAVLQDADLASGDDIDVLAEAQCAAEGIFGLEAHVAALSRSALEAPIVVAAATGAEHWRELFVVAEVGTTVLEGYIDLLVRTPDGLVIVDYKTDQWRTGRRPRRAAAAVPPPARGVRPRPRPAARRADRRRGPRALPDRRARRAARPRRLGRRLGRGRGRRRRRRDAVSGGGRPRGPGSRSAGCASPPAPRAVRWPCARRSRRP